MTRSKKIIALVVCVLLPVGLGFLSSTLSGNIRGSYESMAQPPLSPPGWVFGVVWPILYVLMGVASWLVFTQDGAQRAPKTRALVAYGVQLALNFLWSIVFFGADAMWAAVALIVVLDAAVVLTMVFFSRVSKPATWLLAPYLLWILFATYLAVATAVLN